MDIRFRRACSMSIAISGLALTACGGGQPANSTSEIRIVSGSPRNSVTASPDPTESESRYTGTHWRVTSVRHDRQAFPVSACQPATIEFRPTGKISMLDTVAPLSGRFVQTADGFTTSDMAIGAIAVDRNRMTRAQQETMDAIHAVGGALKNSPAETAVKARFVNQKLILDVSAYQLVLERRSAQPLQQKPSLRCATV